MVTLGSLFLQRANHFSPWQTGLTLSCIYIASMISNPLFGRLSDGGRIRWTSFLLVFAAITIFIFPHLPPQWFLPMLAAYGFFFMASYPVVEAALMESTHDSVRGRVFGCFITVGGLLGNLSHWFVGEWVKQLGPQASAPAGYFAIYNLLGIFVLGSLLALIFLHTISQHAKKNLPSASNPASAKLEPQSP